MIQLKSTTRKTWRHSVGDKDRKTLFRRSDPEYPAMSVLNTVLGGYFGSRLMSNIREDKGYTYGIGSALVSMKEAGYFLSLRKSGPM